MKKGESLKHSTKQIQVEEVRRFLRLFKLTIAPLYCDLNFAELELRKDSKSQFWRRTVIRCLLASVEAILWNMKHMAPAIASVTGVHLTTVEIELANEIKTVTNATSGQIETRTKYLAFKDNIKATFSLFYKVHGIIVTPTYDKDFDALCATYGLRNRLMHPKKPFDPNVSDSDIGAARQGVNWLSREYTKLVEDCGQTVSEIKVKQRFL